MSRGRNELIGVKSEELRQFINSSGLSIRKMTEALKKLAEEHSEPAFRTSPSFLSQIVTGKRSPGPVKAKGLCLLLNIKFDDAFYMKTNAVKFNFD